MLPPILSRFITDPRLSQVVGLFGVTLTFSFFRLYFPGFTAGLALGPYGGTEGMLFLLCGTAIIAAGFPQVKRPGAPLFP